MAKKAKQHGITCKECNGEGVLVAGHGNDPYAREYKCECDGGTALCEGDGSDGCEECCTPPEYGGPDTWAEARGER